MKGAPLVGVHGLRKHFHLGGGVARGRLRVRAVDGVSFTISRGETLGLVGESGCGKTTLGRTMLRLYEPTSGSVTFEGREIFGLSPREMHGLRRHMQMMFQDPYASLNPRMTVGEIVGEPLEIHMRLRAPERKARVSELLELVGLSRHHAEQYPHEFSGGGRQRIGLARALALEPRFLVLDEPISALDVSIQAQVVNLLVELQERLGLTYLFIAHDLSTVRYMSDRVAVMYMGVIVEVSPSEELYEAPLHPYTRALLSAIPIPDPDVEAGRKRILLEGEVPGSTGPLRGCRFRPRCPEAAPACAGPEPKLVEVGRGHSVACHRVH